MRYKKSPSWVPVILSLIFFFPIGFYLLYRKLAIDTSLRQSRGIGLKRAGIILIVLGVIYLLPSDEVATSVSITIFAAFVGVGCFYLSQSKNFKRGEYLDVTIPVVEPPVYQNPRPPVQPPRQNSQAAAPIPKQAMPKHPAKKLVTCPGCGAQHEIIEGSIYICDYCDTKLH